MEPKATKMKALYLTYDGLTDPLGQSQVLPYIQGLKQKGFDFTIISFEKAQNYKKERAVISGIVDRSGIGWVPLSYTKNPPVLSTIYDINKFKKAVAQAIKKDEVTLIHCRSYISALVGLWAKKKYGIPFVFDMRGFWADERVDGKIWSLNNVVHNRVYKYFKKKEKEFLTEAAYTISLTYAGKEEIESWNLKGQSPIQVIPCCTDENHFNISKKENKRKELGLLDDDFIISYLGSIGTWYMLDEMLDFFKELKKLKNQSKFMFITKDDPNVILTKCEEKGLNLNDIIIKPSSRNDVPAYINTSDVSIFFIKPVYSKKASSPTKMGEIMNMGIPVVCNSGVGDVDVVMNKVLPEFLVHSFHSKSYQSVAAELIKNQSNFKIEKIVSTSTNYFSLSNGIENYYNVYQSILD